MQLRRISKAVKGPAILLVLYLCFFWRLTLSHQFTWLEGPDTAYQVVPWFEAQARAIHSGELPLWDPYEWGGQSFLGQMQPGTAYPLNWLLFALPLKNGFIRQLFLHWYFVLIHYLGGLFCYLLCRDRGLGLFASLAGGAAFGFSGWMMSIDWPQMLNGAIWAPLLLLFLLRTLEPEGAIRDAGLAGAILGISFLSGHHQIPILLMLASAGVLVYLWILHGRLHVGRAVKKTALFLLLAALWSGLQNVPAFEYGRTAIRWVSANTVVTWHARVPYAIHEQYSLKPADLLNILLPHPWADSRVFLGWVLALLAVGGAAAAWKDRAVRVFSFLGLAGLLLALGGNSVYNGLSYTLAPLVEKARSPGMATFLFDFPAAVLAAYGADSLWRTDWTPARLRAAYRTLYIAAAVLAALAAARIDAPALAISSLAALLGAFVFQARACDGISSHAAGLLLALVSLFELGAASSEHFRYRDQPGSLLGKLYRQQDIAAFLRKQPQPVRIETDRSVIPYNFGDWFGIDAFDSYTASMPVNMSRIAGSYWARMLLSLRYSLANAPAHPRQAEVFSSASGTKVYENLDAFPRAWAVHKIVPLRSEEQIAPALAQLGSALRSEALLAGEAPKLESCAGEDVVAVPSIALNRVSLTARMACQGMVIASEVFAPGWRAYVDGKREKIWPAYTFLRGIIVPAGVHRIEFVYRPAPVTLGGGMTLLGALLSFYIVIRRP